MLTLIDRYLIRSIIPPFLIALLVFTFIQLVPFLVKLVEPLVAKGVPAPVILKAMATLLPMALAVTIPISLLVALLVGLGRLSTDREWVAMQSCGVSVFQLIRPVAVVSVVTWAATSWVMIWGVPSANQMFREIQFGIAAQRAESEVRPRIFFEEFPKSVLYVRDVPKDGNGWQDVFLADTKDPDAPVIYLAKRGRLVLDRNRQTAELVLEDGTQHQSVASAPENYNVAKFEQLTLSLDPGSMFQSEGPAKGDNEKTVEELQASIAESRRQGTSTHNAIMAIHQKFSIPAACLVFGLLALSFGLTTRRDAKMSSFMVGVGLVFVYYLLLGTGTNLAKGQWVPAWLAKWIPNIVLAVLGLALLLTRGPRGQAWRARSASLARWFGGLVPPKARERIGAVVSRLRGREAGGRLQVGDSRPWLPRPSLLDLYVTKTYLRLAGLSFLALMGIFYISNFLDLSEKLYKGKTTWGVLGQYMWYATPQFAYYCIPLAVLIGVLVTVGMLTRTSELTVMRACGISLYRTALPLVLLAMGASTILFLFDENVLAYSNRREESLRHEIRTGSPRTFNFLNRQWIVGKDGSIYNYVYFDAVNGRFSKLSVFKFAPKAWRLQSRSFFMDATFTGKAAPDATRVAWNAKNGWIREFDRQIEERSYRPIPSMPLELEPPSYFATEQPDPIRMTYRQLRYYIADLRTSGFNVLNYEVALHRKISFPWVTVIMTLIAVPFGLTTGRKGAMFGIGLGVALSLGYWVTMSIFIALGQGGAISPVLAAWAPNVLFGAAALYLLLTVRT
jgi:LPS export ABC transporter permease LptF/LPS export ABC transporter permease LptG